MKKFTKVLALILSAVLVVACFAACSKATEDDKQVNATQSDFDYIKEKGKLVVGITEFEPMDYKDANGEWIGFDADLGKAVAEKMGVDVEFVIIDWDNKFLELDTKAIDCIWNGMTITNEVKQNSSVSNAYAVNQQIVVMNADKAANYTTVESLKDLTFAVENGSAGQEAAEAQGLTSVAVTAQADALLEVKSGAVDACIIDSTMALAMTGEGTDYADLTTCVSLAEEQYGISFRKDSDMTEKMNAYLEEFKADGTLKNLSEKYGVLLAD